MAHDEVQNNRCDEEHRQEDHMKVQQGRGEDSKHSDEEETSNNLKERLPILCEHFVEFENEEDGRDAISALNTKDFTTNSGKVLELRASKGNIIECKCNFCR